MYQVYIVNKSNNDWHSKLFSTQQWISNKVIVKIPPWLKQLATLFC